MGQQPGAGTAAGNRVIRRRCRDDGVAGPAGELGADMPDHLEPARHVIERFGDVLADPAQRTAAGGAGAGRGMNDILARQVFRQRTPGRLLRLGGSQGRRRHDRRGGGEPLGLVGFQRLDRQLELLGFARQLLRRAAELGPPVTRQLEAQLGDLRLGGDRILRHRGDDPLQRLRVIGQLIGRDRHPVIESRPDACDPPKRTADSLCRGSPGQLRLGGANRPPPVDPLQQHR